MSEYLATVVKTNCDVEEEVTLYIEGYEVTGFAGVCPYKISEGGEYWVSLELVIFDEYQVEELECEKMALERIGESFSYLIKGRLSNGLIDCGICFEDEVLLSDYGYLDGKFVRIKADRIDVEFLEGQREHRGQSH